ncbi:MAG: hypothetical protein MSG64_20460 [Pyrinomonadaceae bacterium MAG19_C2-C3]|nr:hypothetical protein [Pyrinomonadaceae bacterium MAG19_C2-C3]
MSDEQPTKRFDEQDRTTQPMLETLLREFRAFRVEVNQRFEESETRLDRIESLASQTRAEMLTMRADFRELRAQVRDALPLLVK